MDEKQQKQYSQIVQLVRSFEEKTAQFADMLDKFSRMYLSDRFLVSKNLVVDGANIQIRGRMQENKGADIASANDLNLGSDGNTFTISGTTTINAISVGTWFKGNEVTLIFSGALTVKHNTSGSTGTAKIFLSGSADLTTAANTVLTLVYDGTQWQEKSRKVA
jgi:hypothetical protein